MSTAKPKVFPPEKVEVGHPVSDHNPLIRGYVLRSPARIREQGLNQTLTTKFCQGLITSPWQAAIAAQEIVEYGACMVNSLDAGAYRHLHHLVAQGLIHHALRPTQ